MLTWNMEISHVRQAPVLPSPALRHSVGVFSSLDHGQVTLKIWDQDQLFSTGQITETTNPVCFILVAFFFPLPISIPMNITQAYCLSNVLFLHRRGFGNNVILCSVFLDRRYNPFMYPVLLWNSS